MFAEQATLAAHWMSEPRSGRAEGTGTGDESDDDDVGDDALKALRSEVCGTPPPAFLSLPSESTVRTEALVWS